MARTVRVKGHLRKGRAVRGHARRITKTSRLYRVETRSADAFGRNRFLLELTRASMPTPPWSHTEFPSSAMRAAMKVHAAGGRFYFTSAGWKRYGKPAYLKVRAVGVRPRIRHARGGLRLDRWQAIR